MAMFCAAYKKHLNVSYRRYYGDPKRIADIDISAELLDLYFTTTEWWGKQPKSITNLAKNYNALLQLQAKPTANKKGKQYPNEWSKTYESKLKGQELQGYWKHLRSLGLSPKKDAMNNTIDWVKLGLILLILIAGLSSCMTPKRVQRYLADNPQLLPAPQVDTIMDTTTVISHDTILLLPDTTTASWGWTWGDATEQDSTFEVPTDTNDRPATTTVTARDTTHEGKPRTVFRVRTVIERDTLVLTDTIQVEVLKTNTRTVIVKPKSWTRYIPWAMGLLVLIAIVLWRRR